MFNRFIHFQKEQRKNILKKSVPYVIATLLLLIMFLTSFSSILDESFSFDETAHIAAGYSYLTQKDMRLNPEHPPLIKDLAASPLLFLDLNFPETDPSWVQKEAPEWWFQFDFASQFLYRSNNDPDQILIYSRLAMILLLIFLGWFLFKFSKELFGIKVSLLVLTLFAFSPTFIAHGRLITTDVGATLGVIMATYFWLKFLRDPSKKNIFLAGLVFGISMLIKFSLALLIPFFAIITVCYAILWKKSLLKYIGLTIFVGIIAVIFVIWPIYQFHVLNYPIEKQISDTIHILGSSSMGFLDTICIWMAKIPGIRGLSYYLLGLLMATHRTAVGNSVYFMGMLSGSGWWFYFPVVYSLKIPLSFHILTLIAVLGTFIQKSFLLFRLRLREQIKAHFTEFSMLVFLAIYWFASMSGKLNIGIRHILPTLPFIYILVSLGTVRFIERIKKPILKKTMIGIVLTLFIWYIASSLGCFPYYLSYFNEIGGGYKEGYKYVVDSNYDWGQDLKRLKKWVENPPTGENIEKIKLDYFGGGNPEYYLGERYERYDPAEGPVKGWLAVSVNQLQGGIADPVPEFDGPSGYYKWLEEFQPVGRAGTSIFIYYIPFNESYL